MDPNINRWITASLRTHFDGLKGDCPLYFEGAGLIQDPSSSEQADPEFAEFRCDGPTSKGGTKGEDYYYVEVNILITVHENEVYADRIDELLGRFQNAFARCIPVWRYGKGTQDDNTLVGRLQLRTTGGEALQCTKFGRIKTDVATIQGCVEGHYVMEVTDS